MSDDEKKKVSFCSTYFVMALYLEVPVLGIPAVIFLAPAVADVAGLVMLPPPTALGELDAFVPLSGG